MLEEVRFDNVPSARLGQWAGCNLLLLTGDLLGHFGERGKKSKAPSFVLAATPNGLRHLI
jgi:hypothetical protein